MLENRTKFQIAKKDLKNYFYKIIIVSFAVSILIEIRVAIMELSLSQHFELVTKYSGVIGVILFSGIFLGENNPALRELINSKYIDLLGVYIVRYILSCFMLVFILLVWGLIYARNGDLNYASLYFVNALVNSFLFGNVTFALYILKNNVIITYMVSFVLFMLYVENLNVPYECLFMKNCLFLFCGFLMMMFSFLGIRYRQKV